MLFYGKIKNRYKRIGGKDMERSLSEITEEDLQEMSAEQIVELKVETEDLIERLDNIIDICNEESNS